MKRVLVTGSSGQLGMTIRELAPGFPDLDFHYTDKTDLDITKSDQVSRSFEQIRPHYCINCAAYNQVDQAERDPDAAYEVNVKGVIYLVNSCKKFGSVLIHISTDYVFDGTNEKGYRPEDEPNPINVYGRSKLQGEQEILKKLQRYFIIRTSWLYSRKYGHNFYKTILSKAKSGEPLRVTDKQRGCPTDAANLAQHILKLIEAGHSDYGISHYTDGVAMTWYEFALHIIRENHLTVKVESIWDEKNRSFAPRPINSVLR